MKGKKRKEQPSFQAFRAHYTFEARFCNPAKGNEKGGVEGQIKSLRKNLMVPIPRVTNLEELNEQLLEGCDRWSERILGGREERKTIKERFGEERGCLLALPKAPFEAAHVTTARVNKYQTVQIKKVRYSVPTEYVGRNVDVRVTCERVEIGWGGKKIAQHSRSFRAGQWQLEPQHYLGLIKRKVGAFERARVIQDWREKWPESHEKLLQNWRQRHGEGSGNREFLEVLTLYGAYPASEVEKAVELAAGCGLGDSKSVRSLLQSRQEEEADREGLAEERLPESCRERHEAPNLAKYDALVVKG